MLCYFSKPSVQSFLILLISEFSIKAWKAKGWRTRRKLSRRGKRTKTEKKYCSSVPKMCSTLPDEPWGLSDFQISSRQIWSPHNSQVKRKWSPFPKGSCRLVLTLDTSWRGWISPNVLSRAFPWLIQLPPSTFPFLRNHMKDRGTAESLLNALKKTLIEDSTTIMMMGVDVNEDNTYRLAHLHRIS